MGLCHPLGSGGGYSCYDYDTDTFSEIRPRFGYRVHDEKRIEPFRKEGYDPYGVNFPRIGSQFETYNYDTGEFGIITPRFGGGFTIDEY